MRATMLLLGSVLLVLIAGCGGSLEMDDGDPPVMTDPSRQPGGIDESAPEAVDQQTESGSMMSQ